MGVPKRKPSHSRQRMRRAYNSTLTLPQIKGNTCPQCAAPYIPHRVCPACGFYKGRQVLTVKASA